MLQDLADLGAERGKESKSPWTEYSVVQRLAAQTEELIKIFKQTQTLERAAFISLLETHLMELQQKTTSWSGVKFYPIKLWSLVSQNSVGESESYWLLDFLILFEAAVDEMEQHGQLSPDFYEKGHAWMNDGLDQTLSGYAASMRSGVYKYALILTVVVFVMILITLLWIATSAVIDCVLGLVIVGIIGLFCGIVFSIDASYYKFVMA